MRVNDNAALARRWFDEVWNTRRDATVQELLAADAVGHLEGITTRGIAEFFAARAVLLNAFPDLRITVEEVVAQDDNVVVRWSAKGTHRGELIGIATTMVPVSFRGLTWLRFTDGQIVEGWDAWNQERLVNELKAAAAQGRP